MDLRQRKQQKAGEKLYNEEIHEMHSLINIIRMVRSQSMRGVEHTACMEENEMHIGY